NVAKPMHVGHIRSTVIGDALQRILQFLGNDVVSDNHLGDWGTQFGMIIYGYRHFVDSTAFAQAPIAELGRLYRLVRELMDYHDGCARLPDLKQQAAAARATADNMRQATVPTDKQEAKKHDKAIKQAVNRSKELADSLADLQAKLSRVESNRSLHKLATQHAEINESVLQETAKLHAGDEENRSLWEQFLPQCRADIQEIYDRLGVKFNFELGESFYHPMLADVVLALAAKGMVKISEGATCVFLDGFDAPMIVRKKDGAFLYATTDLATIQYRMKHWQPDAILYVVDFRQGDHFQKLFAAARQWGYHQVEFQHVSFGTVMGPDGKPFRTRAGDTVGLAGLLDEAEAKALEVVNRLDDQREPSEQMDSAARREVAKVVGIGALKYADLSQNRTSDYEFSLEKMVALEGNTATYIQYAYARVQGIFKRGGIDIQQLRDAGSAIVIADDAERQLALQLLQFDEAIIDAAADYRPNLLTNYLYELARSYASFFDRCPVLKAESDNQRDSRLLLCDLTARTLKQGLKLLNIDVVDRM
ncbi:MAG: arginine--tRNA ligase, partial [Planctomycetales bacterium]|nr:arginine--tRNA ligase [Planctomycetales bacterium]